MMSSATAFAPLLAPVLDDSMEVSTSPAGNHYDDEVLIDYDDYGTAAFPEDEHMVEDGDPIRPGTATDDMMEDAEPRSPIKEEIMHDDPVAVAPESYIEDEELIDYSDDEYQDDTQVTLDDPIVHITEAAKGHPAVPAGNPIEPEIVNEATVQSPTDQSVGGQPTANILSAVAEDDDVFGVNINGETAVTAAILDDDQTGNIGPDDAADELSRQVDAEEAAAEELGVQAFEEAEPDVQATSLSDGQPVHDETEVLKNPPKFPTGLDTSACFAPDGPQTPSDTGIHPITVRYGDVIMPLFKSRIQSDGLLKDDNLASVSLGDLLDNCRHRLALKIGESISADQELVLSFENMGLQLVEHSPHAFETSLDDVLGVYLNLHRNDSTHPIPPLALSLSLQLKFTSSFNILKTAAQQGEGMSKFSYLRSGADELAEYEDDEEQLEEVAEAEAEAQEEREDEGEEYDRENDHDEEYPEDEPAGEEQQYEGEDNFTETHSDGEVPHLEEGQEYEDDQYPENQEQDQEDGVRQSHDAHQDDTLHEQYDGQHQTDSITELEHHGDNDNNSESGADLHNDSPDADTEHNAQESEEHVRPESAASSTTVRGDLTNDTTGEYYNDDFIDFGDDDLTAETAELHVDDGSGKVSSLPSDHDAEDVAADAVAANDDYQLGTTSEAFALEFNAAGLSKQQPKDGPNGEVAQEISALHETDDEADDDAYQHGQDEDALADNLELNEVDLPAEDDDQVDTAFDLLEGHDFEDVAENGEPAAQESDVLEYDDDDIGFNDDVEEAVLASGSPLGKRSFDEHIGKDGVADEQESKKVRS